MKIDEIRSMSDDDLHRTLEEHKQELFNLRFQLATRKTKNHQRIPQVKREIARIQTILRERDLMVEYGGADVDQIVAPAAPGRSMSQASGRRGGGLLGRLRGRR